MNDAQEHYVAALEIARQAREDYLAEPASDKFRIWRDASEIAIKWNRACRLDGDLDESFDKELEHLLK